MISIIVPYFNAKLFLPICIKCLSMQTEQDLEILMIDDGSTDHGDLLCEQAAASDKRFHCLSQKHAGVSTARNFGINRARGDWIIFMDVDDLLNPNTAQLVASEKFSQYDLLLFGNEFFSESPEKKLRTISNGISSDGFMTIPVTREQLLQQVCNHLKSSLHLKCNLLGPCAKAYRTEFLERKQCQFPAGLAIGEDILFNIKVYASSPNTLYLGIGLAYCYQNVQSTTKRYIPKMMQINERFCSLLTEELHSLGLWEHYGSYVNYSALNGILVDFEFDLFHPNATTTEQEKKKRFQSIVKDKNIQLLLQGSTNHAQFSWKKKIVLWAAAHHLYYLVRSCILFEQKRKRNSKQLVKQECS